MTRSEQDGPSGRLRPGDCYDPSFMMKHQVRLRGRGCSWKNVTSHRDTGIRIASRSEGIACLTLVTLASGLGCSGGTIVDVPDGGSQDLPDVGSLDATLDLACSQPLDAGQPFGGCPAQFGDGSWKSSFCAIAVGTVSEQTCAGYLLRQFDLGTHGWQCFYDPTTQTLVAGKFADDVPTFCNHQSSTEIFGTVPPAGSCPGPLAALSNPCGPGVCADPSAGLPPAPCAPGWYLYQDNICGPPPQPGQPSACTSSGDGLCHFPCRVDGDCTDPCFPKCGTIPVFGGSDVSRPKSVCTKGPT